MGLSFGPCWACGLNQNLQRADVVMDFRYPGIESLRESLELWICPRCASAARSNLTKIKRELAHARPGGA